MHDVITWLSQSAHILLVLTVITLVASQFHNPTAVRVAAIASGLKSLVPMARKRKPGPMFVVLVNYDTLRSDITPAWLERIAAAMTRDLTDSFLPEYGLAAWSVTTDQSFPGPRLAIFGKSDVPGALGYHDVGPNGMPYGDAFADGETLDELSETLSHELKELIGDLTVDRWRFTTDGKGYAEEACDAVQGSPYRVDGVLMANHVLQAWYQVGSRGPWDKAGALNEDHALTPGGYVITMVNGVVDTFPKAAKFARRKSRPNARTAKRLAHSPVNPVIYTRDETGTSVDGAHVHESKP